MKSEIERVWKEPIVWDGSVETKPLEPLMDAKDITLLQNRMYPVIYRGAAGVGKTRSLLDWGLLNGYNVYIQECSSDMVASDLTGKWGLKGGETVYLMGETASALQASNESKKVLLLFDEINLLPQVVLKGIGSVFDFRLSINTDLGRIEGNEENIVIAGTMNSEVDSGGYDLDPALRSRCIVCDVKYEEMFRKICKLEGFDERWSKLMIGTRGLFSLRELEQIAQLTNVCKFTIEEAFSYILMKYPEQDRDIIKNQREVVGI